MRLCIAAIWTDPDGDYWSFPRPALRCFLGPRCVASKRFRKVKLAYSWARRWEPPPHESRKGLRQWEARFYFSESSFNQDLDSTWRAPSPGVIAIQDSGPSTPLLTPPRTPEEDDDDGWMYKSEFFFQRYCQLLEEVSVAVMNWGA